MKFLTLALATLGIILGLSAATSSTQAYTQVWAPFPTNVITYECGVPELAAVVQQVAAVSNIKDGGCSSFPMVEFQVIDPWPYADHSAHARPLAGGRKIIETAPWYTTYPPLVMHEFLHTLGLGHSQASPTVRVLGDPGPAGAVMHWNPCNRVPGTSGPSLPSECNTLNADDIAGLHAFYPDRPPPTPTPEATETPTPSSTPTVGPTTVPPTGTPTQTPTRTPTRTPTPIGEPPVQPTPLPTSGPQPPTPTPAPTLYRRFLPGLARSD